MTTLEAVDDNDAQPAAPIDAAALQALSDGRLPEQLMGATSMLQEQLKVITEEMNKLKGELYAEQGGLASKLSDLTQRIQDPSLMGDLDVGAGGAVGSKGLGCRSRQPASAMQRGGVAPSGATSVDAPRQRAPGRRVEFEPGTRDPQPQAAIRNRGGRMANRHRQQTPWTPYIVGFVLLSVGPMRPLLWELLKALYESLQTMLLGPGSSTEDAGQVPWYDQ